MIVTQFTDLAIRHFFSSESWLFTIDPSAELYPPHPAPTGEPGSFPISIARENVEASAGEYRLP